MIANGGYSLRKRSIVLQRSIPMLSLKTAGKSERRPIRDLAVLSAVSPEDQKQETTTWEFCYRRSRVISLGTLEAFISPGSARCGK